MVTISIIGGGATGSAVLLACLKKIRKNPLKQNVQIDIFEPQESLGKGLAYADLDPRFLLNVSASIASINHEDHDEFVKWIQKHRKEISQQYPNIQAPTKDSFLPRALFGKYVEDTLREECNDLDASHIKIQHIREFVNDRHIHTDTQKLRIITNKNKHESDYVIICTGYADGMTYSYSQFANTPNYYPSPYLCLNDIKKIPENEKILVIGTRLSAIDIAIVLQNHSHVRLTSRQGLLPAVRSRLSPSPPKYLTEEIQNKIIQSDCSFVKIKSAIEKELSFSYNKKIKLNTPPLLNPIDQLKLDLSSTESGQNLWQDSIVCFIHFLVKAWPFLSVKDKKTFFREGEFFIHRYISAFPYENAKILYEILKSGRTSIYKGMHHLEYKNKKFNALFNINDQVHQESFDHVINATSLKVDACIFSSELFHSLSKHGILHKNSLGGIRVNREYELKGNHVCTKQIYMAGPPIKGVVPFTNLLLSSSEQAHVIANSLYNKIRKTT